MANKQGYVARPFQVNGAMLGGLDVSADGVYDGLIVAASGSSQTGSLNGSFFATGDHGGSKTIIHAINHLAVTQGLTIASNAGSINTNASDITNIKASDVTFTAGAGMATMSGINMDAGTGQTVTVAVDRVLQDLDDLAIADSGKMIYSDSSGSFAYSDISAAGRAILDDANAAAQRTTLGLGTVATYAFIDEDNMASNSATAVPSQQSVKAYVDSQVGGASLEFAGDTGGSLSIDLDSEALSFTGGTGISAAGSGNEITYSLDADIAALASMQTGAAAVLASLSSSELDVIDGDTAATSTTLAAADRIVVNDDGTMVQVALSDLEVFMESNLDTLNSVTSATSLASVGTITSGVWNGTKIASAYLDDDTAHLSGAQSFSGAKTFAAGCLKIVGTAANGTSTETYTVEIDGGILKLNPAG